MTANLEYHRRKCENHESIRSHHYPHSFRIYHATQATHTHRPQRRVNARRRHQRLQSAPTKPDSAEALSIGPLPRENRDERQPDSSRSSFHRLSGQQGSLAAALSGKQPWEDWFRISSRVLPSVPVQRATKGVSGSNEHADFIQNPRCEVPGAAEASGHVIPDKGFGGAGWATSLKGGLRNMAWPRPNFVPHSIL
jgi:hypothetical protein